MCFGSEEMDKLHSVKLDDILKSVDTPKYLKTRLFKQCALPVMTYIADIWTQTQKTV